MRYALLILTLLFSINAHSDLNEIKSFKDSIAIMTISEFMYENSEDMGTGFLISDEKTKVSELAVCNDIATIEIERDIKEIFDHVQAKFPDEDLPFIEAMMDMRSYLNDKSFMKCTMYKNFHDKSVMTYYYYDKKDQTHLRVDTITLELF